MKLIRPQIVVLLAVVLLTGRSDGWAQTSALGKLAKQLVARLLEKGGSKAAKELAELGGEKAVREVLETATREGGEQLVERLAAAATTHGSVILRGAKVSPAKFLTAFESVEPSLREAALQGIRREPDLMARLVAEVGRDALVVEARHPGIGIKVLKELGADGANIAAKLSADEAVRLSRMAKSVGSAPTPQRRELLDLVAKAPAKTMSLLEKHPNVLTTAALLTAFLASKEQLFGNEEVVVGPDGAIIKKGKPGFFSRILELFHGPVSGLLYLAGAAFVVWAGIKIWGTYRITRVKVASAEKTPSTPGK